MKNQYFANKFLIKIRIWELFFTHFTHWLGLSLAQQISFLSNWFIVKYKFPFPTLRFLEQNDLELLKDRFL